MPKIIYSKRIEYVTAMATVIIAFTGLAGLFIAVINFIEVRFKILGIAGSAWISTAIVICLLGTIAKTKRFMQNDNKQKN